MKPRATEAFYSSLFLNKRKSFFVCSVQARFCKNRLKKMSLSFTKRDVQASHFVPVETV